MNEEIKEPIKRRRKSLPPFAQVGTFNTIKTLPAIAADSDYNGHRSIDNLSYSPYVNLIPLQYLTERKIGISDEAYVNYDGEEHMRYASMSQNSEDVFEYLRMAVQMSGRYTNSSRMKGCMLLMYNNIPCVLPAILPENLVYQKLHILKYGTIDLLKVIVLIDSELDSTSFPSNFIRTIYRNELLPNIVQTSCTVFKVPLSFIKENCFYDKTGDIFPSNLIERRKAKQEFIEDFKQYVQTREEIVTMDISALPSIGPLEALSGLRSEANIVHSQQLTGTWTYTIPHQGATTQQVTMPVSREIFGIGESEF